MSRYLFVTGMFRSGTTLMAKVFDAHSKVAFTSDPYRPFFNDLRDTIASNHQLLKEVPPHFPLSDYFCHDEERQLFQLIQNSDFDIPIAEGHLPKLKEIMARRGEEFSLFTSQRMNEIEGSTYKELYVSMMKLIQSCYGRDKNVELIGSKEVWSTEFTPALLKSFPESKAILVVRDPRAVFSSRNSAGEKYPWLWMVRQWRKLSMLAWYYTNNEKYKSSTLLVKYEDLVSQPEAMARRMCDFLNIEFDEAMLDGTQYKDGDGSNWKQNSTYGTGTHINKNFADKWKSKLTPDEVRLIETLCYPEMKQMGYEFTQKDVEKFSYEVEFNPIEIPKEELAGWIQPHSLYGKAAHLNEMAKERMRDELLHMSATDLAHVKPEVIQSFFLNEEIFNCLRKKY